MSQFPEFFKVALRERFASQRKGLNLDFDWHARYIGAFLHFAKRPTINTNRPKTAPQTVHKRGARKKLAFLAPGGASASILVAPKRSRALPGALPGTRGHPWGLSGRPRDATRTIPGRSRGMLRTLRMFPGSFLGAMGCRGDSRERF